MIFLGLDVGSSGTKCVAFSEDGRQLAVCYREYKTRAGQADMDAREMFASVCEVISGCAADPAVNKAEIASICVTSFGESFVPVDKNGNELSNIIMYTDKRGMAECQRIIDKVGYEKAKAIICAKPDSMYSLPKIVWTLENVEGVRENIYKFLLIGDYICFKLSGEAKINYSLACRAMAFDVENLCWSKELLDAAGIDASLLADPVPCGSVVGDILPSVADKLGIPSTVKVIIGAHDQVSAALGAGVLNAGEAVDGTGSVECVTPLFDKIIRTDGFADHNFVCIPNAAQPGLFCTYAFNFSGGVLLKWFRDCFASGLKPEAERRGVSVYRMLDESCPDTPTDVLVVPHFMGAGGTPDLVATAKGTITGMSMATTLPDIYRATMEGLTFEIAYNIEMLSKFGIGIKALRATGGGARSPIWLRIKTDILGLPITQLKTEEAGAAGCAMLSAVAMGKYANLKEAAEKFVILGDTYEPETKFASIYADKYAKYKAIREAALNIYK